MADNIRRFDEISRYLREQPTPVIMRFLRYTGRGINRHNMIGQGDRVLLSVSGGKDSLAMALALRLRLRFLPITYRLEAALVDWREHPHAPESLDALHRYFEALEIPFTVLTADMRPDSFGGRFDCYRCGRNRRRILFDHVRSWPERPLIATGHHLDDIVQTTLMNLFFRGSFSTMMPVQPFFSGELAVIRPLCEVREELVRAVSESLDLPVTSIDCPFHTTNVRARIRPLIEEVARINPQVRENINRAHTNIDHQYLPEL